MRHVIAVLALLATSLALAQAPDAPVPPPPAVMPASPAGALPDAERSHFVSLTLQPIPWAIGIYGGTAEFALGSRMSLAVGWNVTFSTTFATQTFTTTPTSGMSNNWTLAGAGIQPGVNFFLSGRAPEGLWVGPKLELSYLSATLSTTNENGGRSTTNSINVSGVTYGGHVMVGYTAIVGTGLTFQGGVGIGLASASYATTVPGATVSSQPLVVTASLGRISLGIGWSL